MFASSSGLGEKLKPPCGTIVIDSTPTHRKASPMPASICAAAMCTACIDEPQKRFTVMPPTSCGSPASSPTMRARLLPCDASG
ncbi:hypothetical protein D9M72_150430 [compost metagenome]